MPYYPSEHLERNGGTPTFTKRLLFPLMIVLKAKLYLESKDEYMQLIIASICLLMC